MNTFARTRIAVAAALLAALSLTTVGFAATSVDAKAGATTSRVGDHWPT